MNTPAPGSEYADTVPARASLFGPVLPCSGPARPGSHGDYAALGQLIADVTGSDYAEAVARLVLGPLGMTSSRFPASWPHDDPDAVTGYELEPDTAADLGGHRLLAGGACRAGRQNDQHPISGTGSDGGGPPPRGGFPWPAAALPHMIRVPSPVSVSAISGKTMQMMRNGGASTAAVISWL